MKLCTNVELCQPVLNDDLDHNDHNDHGESSQQGNKVGTDQHGYDVEKINVDIVKYVLDKNSILKGFRNLMHNFLHSLKKRPDTRDTILTLCIRHERYDFVNVLIEYSHVPFIRNLFDTIDGFGIRPLDMLIYRRQCDIVNKILEYDLVQQKIDATVLELVVSQLLINYAKIFPLLKIPKILVYMIDYSVIVNGRNLLFDYSQSNAYKSIEQTKEAACIFSLVVYVSDNYLKT